MFLLVCAALSGPAWGATRAGKATVKAATLPVYSEMDPTSDVVRTLKKGDALVVNLEIANATGDWCSVSLPGASATLGYVSCGALEVAMPRITVAPSLPGPGDTSSGSGSPANGKRRDVHLSVQIPSASAEAALKKLSAEVVTEDGVNISKLDELDAAAQGGSPAAMDKAAVAHDLAGRYDVSHNDISRAFDQYRAAIGFANKSPRLLKVSLLDIAELHLKLSEYSDALKYLDRARKIDPDSATTAILSGWAYYGLDQLSDAIAQWKKSQQIEPTPQVAQLLAKAERDQKTEQSFQQGATSHFILHYEGGAMPGLAQDVLGTLEEDFESIEDTLGYTPPAPITVILYTRRQFHDVTRAPNWADGLNDGRIRVPVQGLARVTPELGRVLKHELTHSFINQMTQNRAPTWLQEGLAQWMEGLRSQQDARLLVALYDHKTFPPMAKMEGSWMGLDTNAAVMAYSWSLATVEAIIANYQIWGLRRLLSDLTQDSSVGAAVHDALQTNYSELNQQTAEYLRKTYLQ
jgi:predicted negative regulator of RcsB-dependent stress response